MAQQVLEQDLHRERQPRYALESILLGRGQAVKGIGPAAHLEGFAAAEAVERSHSGWFPSSRAKRRAFCGNIVPEPAPWPVATPRALHERAHGSFGLIRSFLALFQTIDTRQQHGARKRLVLRDHTPPKG